MDPSQLRAGDADRERVAERLRTALEEGRLNLHEYDERLREAFAAKTYAELDALLADLPGPAAGPAPLLGTASGALEPLSARWVVAADGTYPHATRRWLAEQWGSWFSAVSICVIIWGGLSLLGGSLMYFWPGWVAGPWGAFLLAGTVSGLARREPQRWAARKARKEAAREVRRQITGED